ncbi:hypothetical protein V9T40_003464 [Parthenolecanium corni]|uniref:Uncharacterized protein n=1 Tax=Parthenolecanium corni TaxID=536013 RepID=A0AAN9TQR5_9HEMI
MEAVQKFMNQPGTGQFTAGELGQFATDYSPTTTRRPANSPPNKIFQKWPISTIQFVEVNISALLDPAKGRDELPNRGMGNVHLVVKSTVGGFRVIVGSVSTAHLVKHINISCMI